MINSPLAVAGAPEVHTDKDVYAPKEPITVLFRNVPGSNSNWVTVVPTGTPVRQYKEWTYLKAVKEGSHTFQGLKKGKYEVRLYLNGSNSEIAALHLFSVGSLVSTKSDQPSSEIAGQSASATPSDEPRVRTEKDNYTWKEPIVVIFENAPGISGDSIMVVSQEMPETIPTNVRSIFLGRSKKGTFTFAAPENMGQYEVRQYRKDLPDRPVARYSFVVGNPTASASDRASSSASDPLAGLWASEEICGKYNSIELQLVVTEFFGTSYAMLRSVNRKFDPEIITFDVYKLEELGDLDGDFFTPERVYNGISSSAQKFQIFNTPGKDSIVIDHAICPEFSLFRVIPSEPMSVDGPFNADWQGYVDACEYFRGYPYDMKVALRELPNGVVVAKAQAIFERAGPLDSYFYGSYGKTKDSISLRAVRGNGNRTLTLEYAAEENRLFGQSEWMFNAGICDYIELSPSGATIASQSGSSESESQAVAAEKTFTLLGEWEGDVTCGGNPVLVLLNIENAPAGRYQGAVQYSSADVISHGVTKHNLVGERMQNGSYTFVINTKKNRTTTNSTRAAPTGFSFVANTESQQLSGRYDGLACTDLELMKRTKDSSSSRVRAAESDAGAFFAKRRPRERCEIIGQWLSKARGEYPETDFWRTPSGQVALMMVLLFADDEFVPVFGKPYDALSSRSAGREIPNQVHQLCQGDPFNQELVKDFRLVAQFFPGREFHTGSFSPAAIRSIVRQTRRIRNITDQVMSSLSEIASFETALQTLEPLKKRINASAEFLWPGEKRDTDEWITTRLGGYALTKANADFQRIESLSDPITHLREMTDVASGKPDYHKYLLAEDRNKLHQRLVGSQKGIADRLIGSTIGAIESLEINVPALSKIGAWENEVSPTLTLLISDAEQFYRNRIEKKRQEVFGSLVSDRISTLEAFSADRSGILANSNWIDEFRRSFSGFEDRELYRNSVARFVQTRRRLLREGVVRFESDLANVGRPVTSQKADELLSDYLSWDGDSKMPISLEYLIVAEAMKAAEQ